MCLSISGDYVASWAEGIGGKDDSLSTALALGGAEGGRVAGCMVSMGVSYRGITARAATCVGIIDGQGGGRGGNGATNSTAVTIPEADLESF